MAASRSYGPTVAPAVNAEAAAAVATLEGVAGTATASACSAEALFPGQWRLARVEVANWGTFGGYHVLPIDRRGTLITGQSGSGKSTLLDAIAAVLTPPANLNLNAAANNGAARDQGRSISNYVRGAYGNQTDASGEIVHSYLRPRAATWSGILLEYEDAFPVEGLPPSTARQHEPVCLLAIFFQRANTTTHDGLNRFYAVLRGDHSLPEFERYGIAGADMASFNKDFHSAGRAWKSHRDFEARLCNALHVQSSKTLVLLHKTQAAKNIGSLDDLFRTYMLDRPRTFELAREAVEQFEELRGAHEGVVDQREQMECLEPLAACDERFGVARAEGAHVSLLQRLLPSFVEETTLTCLEGELERLRRVADELADKVARARAEQREAQQELDAVRASMSNSEGVTTLETAKLHLDFYEQRRATVTSNRQGLEGDLRVVEGLSVPKDRSGFEALKRELGERAGQAQAWLSKSQDEKTERFGALSRIQERQRELEAELRYLRSRPSNVPRRLHELRVDIARHLGISPADLPFMAELIDIRSECRAWQGAIERLLGGRAKTMLTERRHAPAINEYLETHHLGIRFDYDAVPDTVDVPPQSAHEHALSRKLAVKSLAGHESLSRWTNKELRERFDYVCVESASELERHPRALTMAGHIKNREHHTKDDRFRVDDRSQWILGSSNEEKIAEIEAQVRELDRQKTSAQRATEELSDQERRFEAVRRLERSLREKSWDDYDLAQAERDVESAREFLGIIASSEALREKARRFEEASERLTEANRAVEDARVEAGRNDALLADTQQLCDRHREFLEETREGLTEASDALAEASEELHGAFLKAERGYASSLETLARARDKVLDALRARERKASNEEQAAMREAEKTMTRYRERWQVEAADLSSDFEDREAYLARYRQIKASGLPEYERRFLEVLTSFSQDQITVIASEIRGAFREVRERLEPVNRSLMLSEYSPGIHLRIDVKEDRSARVKDFLADLAEITRGSWEDDDFERSDRRYERTAAVMKRLASSEAADVQWRTSVLDTTRHMRFTAVEIAEDGSPRNVHSNDGGLSGGQRQKLVFFCLAAALRYQLADEDQPDPSYGTVVLDEAFDKSDHRFAEEALGIFEKFGFHMVLATPGKLLQVADDHVGSIVMVSCEDQRRSELCPVLFEVAPGSNVVTPRTPDGPEEAIAEQAADTMKPKKKASSKRAAQHNDGTADDMQLALSLDSEGTDETTAEAELDADPETGALPLISDNTEADEEGE